MFLLVNMLSILLPLECPLVPNVQPHTLANTALFAHPLLPLCTLPIPSPITKKKFQIPLLVACS